MNAILLNSVDPCIELAFLAALFKRNISLYYFSQKNTLLEKKFVFGDSDFEWTTLILEGGQFKTVLEEHQAKLIEEVGSPQLLQSTSTNMGLTNDSNTLMSSNDSILQPAEAFTAVRVSF